MEFYYSSIYIEEKINNIEKTIKKYGKNNVELILDTNICIYLRDFYTNPSSIVMSPIGTWNPLIQLLSYIEQYDLEVDYSIGMEEACRQLSDFSINTEKLIEMQTSISSLFALDYFQILEHSKLVKANHPITDKTKRQNTKIPGLLEPSMFQGLLFNTYASLLKLYLLYKFENKLSKLDKMPVFLDFLEKEVNVLGCSDILFAHHYLSGNSDFTKLIHKTKNLEELKIHSLWNAAIDLTLPTLVSNRFIKDKFIPIFVTGDNVLCSILDSIKMRVLITDETNLAHPPFIEINFENACWTRAEIRTIHSHFNKIKDRRKYKFVLSGFDIEKHLNKMRDLCYGLENELKNQLKNS